MAAYIWEAPATPGTQPYAVPPHGKWGPHVCPLFYLKYAGVQHDKGTADLLFDIKPDGNVAGVVVAVSSANNDIDLMSAICVSKWQYEPATVNGAPAEVSWEGQIAWTQFGSKPEGNTPRIKLPATNCIRARPGAADRKPPKDPTAVRYQLVNGEVNGAAVERSSGDAALDDYAAQCVKTWHFLPTTTNGAPATGAFTAVIHWQQQQ